MTEDGGISVTIESVLKFSSRRHRGNVIFSLRGIYAATARVEGGVLWCARGCNRSGPSVWIMNGRFVALLVDISDATAKHEMFTN